MKSFQYFADRFKLYASSSGWLKNRSVYVLAFWLALLLITLFDIIALNDRISVTQIFIYLSLLSVALSIPIKPRLCGWLFIILDVLFIALTPYPVGVLGYVCVAVFFFWGWGKLKLDSAIGALILTAGFLVGSSFIVMGAVMLVLMLATAFNAGYMMKRYMGERDAALSRLWEAELQESV